MDIRVRIEFAVGHRFARMKGGWYNACRQRIVGCYLSSLARHWDSAAIMSTGNVASGVVGPYFADEDLWQALAKSLGNILRSSVLADCTEE